MDIYVKAFLDNNYGDDLMLVKLIKSSPDDFFFIYAECEYIENIYNLMLDNFQNYMFVNENIRDIRNNDFFDCIVLLGGSTLQGNKYKGCFYRLLNIINIRRIKHIKYIILGCNVGPFKNKITEFFVKHEIKSADMITCRDSYSYNYISKINKNVKLYPDMLFNSCNNLEIYKIHDNSKYILGISILYTMTEKQIYSFAYFIDKYISETKNNVYIFAFSTGNNNDYKIALDILNKCRNKDNVEIICNSYDYTYILKKLSECNRIIALRFHSAVLGLSLNIEVSPIIYSNKMENLINDLSYEGKYIYLDKLNLDDYDNIFYTNKLYAADHIIKDAENHIKDLKNLLHKDDDNDKASI